MIINKIKKLVKPRKVHLLCLGAAKTGTTSLAAMFDNSYRTSHEPEVIKTTNLVIQYLENEISDDKCIEQLIERDKRLFLDVEASHPLGYLAYPLIKAFPDAKFIISIRHPLSWLKSRLNFHHSRKPPEWEKYRNYIWARWHNNFKPEEGILQKNGLYSLEAYLRQYNEQYKIIFDSIPQNKHLIIKTEELDDSILKIARFVEIPETGLSKKRTNVLQKEKNLIDLMDKDFVSESIEENCKFILDKIYS